MKETEYQDTHGARNGSPPTVQVVDFFSGCGGASHGFATLTDSEVNFELKGAIDIDPHANATYDRMLDVTPIERDVRDLTDPSELDAVVEAWDIDPNRPLLLIGCAPCKGFSSHRKKDPRKDPRNSLMECFGEIAAHIQPDLVLMENVPEIFHRNHWEHYAGWVRTMREERYRIRSQIHNLAFFGVPQERFRAIVLASRDWSYFAMPKPTHTPEEFSTVRDAIEDLPPIDSGGQDPDDPMHKASNHRKKTVELMSMIPEDGGSRRDLPEGAGPDCWNGVDGFRDVYGRLWWDKPAVAITARCRTPSCGRFVHPTQDRGLTVREAASLQGFPESYQFEGPFDDKFKQIGNAVSPIFSRALAKHISQEWMSDHSDSSREETKHLDVTEPIEKSVSSALASLKRKMRENGPDAVASLL